jgi:alkylation response protein AidB-like acyl-CoA dehydrogenase
VRPGLGMMDRRSDEEGSSLLAEVRRLVPQIKDAADQAEADRELSPGVVAALKRAGVMRMTLPRWLSGLEIDPIRQIEVIEELSRADGSVGWCAMIGSDGGYYASRLPRDAARRLYGPEPDAITAGFIDPIGRAAPVSGGYLVSGRWPFASASRHAQWLASGCHVAHGSESEWRIALLPAEACTLIDSWLATGLLATGSGHYEADDVFVPSDQTFRFDDEISDLPALYRFEGMHRANMAGVPLGIARGAIERFTEMASETRLSTGVRLRDDATAQLALARAEALVGSSRAFMIAAIADMWETLESGHDVTLSQRTNFRLALATVFNACRDAVEEIYRAAGGRSVFRSSGLDRHLRDIVTACQHALFQPSSYIAAGRAMLGLAPDELLY